jgi:hypothetical protein
MMTEAKVVDPTQKIDALVWGSPPVTSKYDWESIADQLRKRPMKWARVFEGDRVAISNAVRQGNVIPVHPDLGFEYKTTKNRREPPRTCDLYMRFNPDKVSAVREAVRSHRKERG